MPQSHILPAPNTPAAAPLANAEERPAVLIVDADKVVVNLLTTNLQASYDVTAVDTAEEAMRLDPRNFALVIAEIDLPGDIDGLAYAAEYHAMEASEGVPLIFCTTRDSEDDILAGFDVGADDYVIKPFSLREMMARIRSVIRRHALTRSSRTAEAAALGQGPEVRVEGLCIRFESQTVEMDGEPLNLSRTEFMILNVLARNRGSVFSREELYSRVWGNNADNKSAGTSRTVDVNISRLRKKLGHYAGHITNRPGQGYSFS